MDPDDADVATFFHYLRQALRKLEWARATDLPRFGPQYAADVPSFSRKFFRQLFSHLKPPFALVVDNLHEVPADSALHAVLEAAFAQVPRKSLLMVTSRQEAPPALARLRVTGEMVTVATENLRLEPGELAEMAKLRGHDLTGQALTELHERTQGWAAGAVLMLEHARLSGRMADFPGDATPQAIFDYLAGEIFERFERKTQQFLLKVACLPRMTGGVAETLTGEPKAARLLVNLAQNDYFVKEVPSESGRVYQFHPLLREFLRSRAERDMPEALAPAQLRRAALLLRNAGQTEDAAALLIEAQEWAEVAAIAAEEAPAMIEQGRSESLTAWLDLLPPQLLAGDPRLHYALGLCKSDESPRAARRHFEQAFERYRTAGDPRGMVESCRWIIEATLMEFDDLTPLDRWIGALDELLGASPSDATGPAVSALIRVFLLRDPGNARLQALLSARAGQPPSIAHAAAALIRGEFAVADALLAELKDRAAADAPDEVAAVGLATALCYTLGGQHARAGAVVAETFARAEADGFGACAPWLHAVAAAAALGAGDLDAARRSLQALEAQRAPLRRGDRALLHYLRVWLFALEADLPASQREARAAMALAAETGMPWLEALARIASAQVAAETADWRAHEAQLRAAEPLVERLQSPLVSFALKLATAAGAVRRGDAQAVAHVAAALALGREHGLEHVPGWMPGLQAQVCAFALENGVECEYVAALVRNRKLVPADPPLLVEGWPWAFRVRTLGSFQLQRGSVPVEAAGKGPGRPMELLKVLIALGGTSVRIDQLADALWPHVEADYAHNSFTATLHRLRRLFGDEEALIVRDSRLSLNRATIWVDIWALEQAVGELDEALRNLPDARAVPALRPLIERLLSLYRGPFLADESEQPAYIACREQLRARVLRALTRAARCCEQGGLADTAIDCYQRFMEAEPLYEAPYRNLMLCYQRAGEPAEARAVFERLQTLLAARLKSTPSAETRAVYAALESSGIASPRA